MGRNETPERKALGEMKKEFLKQYLLKDGNDIKDMMREMLSVVLDGSLEGKLDEELGYSKYDYKNKDTDNSRNGYSKKQCIQAMDLLI